MDSDSKTIQLHNGVVIPTVGLRLKEDVYQNVLKALEAGVRHFDIPADANSEKEAAKAFSEYGISRSELFLTGKLSNNDHGYKEAMHASGMTLKRLDTDYFDLYLIDWPNPKKYRDDYETVLADTWKALETLYKKGNARAIGLSHFLSHHIEKVLEGSEIAPMVTQVGLYPGCPCEQTLNCALDHRIQTIGFLPEGHEAVLNSRELKIFADKYSVSQQEIMLRYMIQKGSAALSTEPMDPESLFNFTIKDEDMKYLDVMKYYGPEKIDPDTCDF